MTTKKSKPLPFGESVQTGDSFTTTHEGFDIHISFTYDFDPDLSFYGDFSDVPEAGAIDHHATGTWLGRSHQGPRYFNPANHDDDGSEAAQADYKRMVEYHQGYWSMLGMTVKVSLDGITLADSSLWGIESDSGKEAFEEMYDDRLAEAMAAAKAKLLNLVKLAKKLKVTK